MWLILYLTLFSLISPFKSSPVALRQHRNVEFASKLPFITDVLQDKREDYANKVSPIGVFIIEQVNEYFPSVIPGLGKIEEAVLNAYMNKRNETNTTDLNTILMERDENGKLPTRKNSQDLTESNKGKSRNVVIGDIFVESKVNFNNINRSNSESKKYTKVSNLEKSTETAFEQRKELATAEVKTIANSLKENIHGLRSENNVIIPTKNEATYATELKTALKERNENAEFHTQKAFQKPLTNRVKRIDIEELSIKNKIFPSTISTIPNTERKTHTTASNFKETAESKIKENHENTTPEVKTTAEDVNSSNNELISGNRIAVMKENNSTDIDLNITLKDQDRSDELNAQKTSQNPLARNREKREKIDNGKISVRNESISTTISTNSVTVSKKDPMASNYKVITAATIRENITAVGKIAEDLKANKDELTSDDKTTITKENITAVEATAEGLKANKDELTSDNKTTITKENNATNIDLIATLKAQDGNVEFHMQKTTQKPLETSRFTINKAKREKVEFGKIFKSKISSSPIKTISNTESKKYTTATNLKGITEAKVKKNQESVTAEVKMIEKDLKAGNNVLGADNGTITSDANSDLVNKFERDADGDQPKRFRNISETETEKFMTTGKILNVSYGLGLNIKAVPTTNSGFSFHDVNAVTKSNKIVQRRHEVVLKSDHASGNTIDFSNNTEATNINISIASNDSRTEKSFEMGILTGESVELSKKPNGIRKQISTTDKESGQLVTDKIHNTEVSVKNKASEIRPPHPRWFFFESPHSTKPATGSVPLTEKLEKKPTFRPFTG